METDTLLELCNAFVSDSCNSTKKPVYNFDNDVAVYTYHCLLSPVRTVNWQPGELSLIYVDDQPHVLQERYRCLEEELMKL